jgi:hypothetical protein
MYGIGSLMGNPLDPYRQYLQQTYVEPQQQQQLNLFMDMLQQQEQQFFGGGSTGFGALRGFGGSPMGSSKPFSPFGNAPVADPQALAQQRMDSLSGMNLASPGAAAAAAFTPSGGDSATAAAYRSHMLGPLPASTPAASTGDLMSAFGSMTARASDRMQGTGLGNPFGSSILGPRI